MPDIVENLRAVCGNDAVLLDDDATDKYRRDWLGQKHGRALAVVLPSSTEEVAKIMRLCNDNKTPVVPQAGNTGYAAAGTPDNTGKAVVLAMEKMRRIREINTIAKTVTVEAGRVLESLHTAVEEESLYFPLSLGAKGSCQIGGNLATNAGGLNALRYGVARDLCLGLEAVMPDGRIMNLLSGLHKNNTGYDIKNLLIGAEGTLGVITAATLKLFAPPATRATAFMAVPDVGAALALLNSMQAQSGGQVESFEIMPKALLQLLKKHTPQAAPPFSQLPNYSVLAEAAGNEGVEMIFEEVLTDTSERGWCSDIIVATSERERRCFWQTREMAPVATRLEGQWLKADVSAPLDKLTNLVNKLESRLPAVCEGHYIIAFGHIGDGNLHISARPKFDSPKAHPELTKQLTTAIYESVASVGGAFSAEHGIGQIKKEALVRYKDPTALALMREIKHVFDPNGIMNPGKIL